MRNRPKNDYAIFFRLPTALVDRIDEAAYDHGLSRTTFIRQCIFRALEPARTQRSPESNASR